ncbi:MAG: 2TM domain-containing protein, partial [Bacteroidota bacterium]
TFVLMDLSEYNNQEEKRRYSSTFYSEKKRAQHRNRSYQQYTPEAFHKNLKSFVGISAVIILINIALTPYHLWALYVVFFWGFNVLNHYFTVYGKYSTHRRSEQVMELDNSFDDAHEPLEKEIEFEPYNNSRQDYRGY